MGIELHALACTCDVLFAMRIVECPSSVVREHLGDIGSSGHKFIQPEAVGYCHGGLDSLIRRYG